MTLVESFPKRAVRVGHILTIVAVLTVHGMTNVALLLRYLIHALLFTELPLQLWTTIW